MQGSGDRQEKIRECRVFLCHNSKDKGDIKVLADALELDFGIPHFLDVYAIPTGEAFIPWIEKALAESTGCAIFLGGNGWGPTHFWEAELALARSRQDALFRLIPVALPGITDADRAKLGSGSLFRQINWADFTGGLDNADEREKLRAALTGEVLRGDRGPARLTPYQIRRDASRWRVSGERDASVLYRGRQLVDARLLARDNPDLLAVGEVMSFLSAAADRQRRFWRNLVSFIGFAALLLLIAAVIASVQYRSAEERRKESVSRQLAMTVRETEGVDRKLLVSVQSYRIAPTLEALRNLFDQAAEWRNLKYLLYAGVSVEALTVANGTIIAGTESGDVLLWEAATGRSLGTLNDMGRHGRVTALYADESAGVLWIGHEDGRVDVARKVADVFSNPSNVLGEPKERKPGVNYQIKTISGHTASRLVVVGTSSGRIIGFDAITFARKWEIDEGETTQVTAIAASRDGEKLFVGTQLGRLMVVDPVSGAIIEAIPGFDGGASLIAVPEEGNAVAVISSYGRVGVLEPFTDGYRTRSTADLPPLITSAAFYGKRGMLALGDGDGNLFLRDLYGSELSFGSLKPHRSVVRTVAFGDGDGLVSAAGDGMIAVWDLGDSVAPARRLLSAPLDPSAIRVRPDNEVIIAGATTGRAAILRLKGSAWEPMMDLLAETERIGGRKLLEPMPGNDVPADGFVAVGDSEVVDVALDGAGDRIVWTTQGGGVLLAEFVESGGKSGQLLDVAPATATSLAISPDGRHTAAAFPAELRLYEYAEEQGQWRKTTLSIGAIRSMAFDSESGRLALGLEDGSIEVISAKDGASQLTTAPIWNGPVGGLLFTPDDLSLISHGVTSADRSLVVLPIGDHQDSHRLQLQQAQGTVTAVNTATKAGYMAVGGLDGRVTLWRLRDLGYAASLTAGGTAVGSIGFDEITGRMITASGDNGLLEWSLDPDELVRSICQKTMRDFEDAEWREVLPDEPRRSTCGSSRAE